MQCPKCGYARQAAETAPDWQCPGCGIAYAKYRPAGETPEVPETAAEPAPAEPRRTLGFADASGIAGLVTVALIGVKGFISGVDFLAGLLMIPFFFCLTPVVSWFFGDGLYMWNKWQMRFERYDSEAHPVLARFFAWFCVVASGVFAVFLFFLPLKK